MASKTEKKRVGDVVLEELGVFGYCREAITAKSAEVLNIGSCVDFEFVDVDEIQTNTGWSGTGSAGTYTITVFDPEQGIFVTTAAIDDASAHAVINAALDNVLSSGGAVVSSGTIESTSWVLTYEGEVYQGIDVPLATVDVSLWTGVSAAIFVQTTAGSLTSKKAILITVAENVKGVCLENLGTLAADKTALFLVRGPAIVNANQLGINSLALATIKEALARLGIIARSEPATSEFQTT